MSHFCVCRILYRARQRGYLELDLLLGKWAEDNASQLDETRLRDLVNLLEEVKHNLRLIGVLCCVFIYFYPLDMVAGNLAELQRPVQVTHAFEV